MLLTENEMANIAICNGDENFVAFAITPWHAHGVDVCISLIKEQGIDLKGTIFICTHKDGKKCLDSSCFINSNDSNIKFIDCEFSEESVLKKIKSNIMAILFLSRNSHGKEFYIINELFPNLNWIIELNKRLPNIRPVYYIVDEGCGSYVSNGVKEWAVTKSHKKIYKYPIYFLIAHIREILKNYAVKLLVNLNSYNECFLFNKIDNKLVENALVKDKYKEIFIDFNKKGNINYSFDSSVLINTQPLVECGYIDDDSEIWKSVIKILDDRSQKIVIKSHPREIASSKYLINDKVKYCDVKISQEMLLSDNNLPLCIISPYSTTLVTAKLFWNIPAISLAKIYLNNSTNEEFKTILKKFIDVFNGYLLFPENYDELKAIIDNILNSLNDKFNI